MKKIINKAKNALKINKKLFAFLLVLVIIGIISGTVLSLMLNDNDQKLVTDYLNSFFSNTNNINTTNTLINTLIMTLGFCILIYLLGISVIGFVIILFMLFGKAFVLGFSLGTIITTYKMKGIIYALIYIFPHHVINLIMFIILSGMALIMSFKIINNITKEKKIDFSGIKKYNYVLLITLGVLLLTSIYEVYAMPNILNLCLNILK